MKFYDYKRVDQEFMQRLALQHPISTHEALEIFTMGGRKHSEHLCKLKSMGKSDKYIEGFAEGIKYQSEYSRKGL